MQEIIISIKPQYSSMIFSGAKTVELRKKIGLLFKPGRRIYIYSSSPVKMLAGEATIASIELSAPSTIEQIAFEKSCISKENFDKYFLNSNEAFAIYLENVIEYDSKVPLDRLRATGITPPQSYCYVAQDIIFDLTK
ncbi:hypothetical protein Q7L38_11160 [Pseudomonas protegens]|uniref:ASCH domain-containing protein n=1 Tax=Pseudomonas protegens TaxID=380021 RepID=UPI0027655479|nr:ASCH domain-containing protein [Pseudomonas protegens]MDP9533130.1 hypothetical protein [Pseudomonas protegens]